MEKDKKDFVHLHLHTEYSLLDGSGKVKKIIKKAKELGMDKIAITDHGVMYGCVDFYKACKDEGIKPILGCEVYVASKSMNIKHTDAENKTNHLVLLVKNEIGYENLMKIASDASIEGFYYKPRVDHEYLRAHSEGLIALSACLGGEVQRNLLAENYDKAKEVALEYKDIFKEGFYLELQNHNMTEQIKVNELNIKLSKETGIPLVATNDVHYINREDSKAHDILMCIQTGKTVDDQNRRRYPSDQFYLKSPEEMYDMFDYIPEALENTVKIGEECNFDYEFHVSKLPKFPLPEGADPFIFLRDACYTGLIKKYDNFEEIRDKEYNYDEVRALIEKDEEIKVITDRLDYELGVINQMGYVDYFLIVGDFIKYSVDQGIPTGPGRGCFLPDTKVTLGDGSFKEIQEFKGGETVLTALGNMKKVATKFTYDVEEEITKIVACNEELRLTNDHKVLAVKTEGCIRNYTDKIKIPTVCRESCSRPCKEAPYLKYEKEWIEARELNKNDFVVYPIPKEEEILKTFDLLELDKDAPNIRYTENEIWYEVGSNKLETPHINRYVELNEDLGRILGYFMAEGWTIFNEETRAYRVGLGFHENEVEYHKDVLELFKKIFNAEGGVRAPKEKHSRSIEVNSKILSLFFSKHCNKGALNKKFSKDILENVTKPCLKEIVAGMFRGDGSHSDIECESSSYRIKYTTVSIQLRNQLRNMLAKLGYYSTFKTRVHKNENWNLEYSICVSGKQLLNWNNDFKSYQIPIREQKFYRNDGFYKDEEYFYIKIKEVSKEPYKGKVYDLSVEDDTSYVANSIAVHNSAAGSIVAYTLDITKIDPLKYSLLFERELRCAR